MRRRLLILGLATALAVPLGAVAQEGPAGRDARGVEAQLDRIEDRMGEDAADRVRALLEGSGDLPAGPLLNKALEGAAKGVPTERVLAALSPYADRLERGARLLDADASPSEVTAAADALSRGVPGETVREVAGAAPSGDRAIPLVVLGDLVEAGVPVQRAAEVVREAIEEGRAGDALLRVPAHVRRMVREGVSPAEAARRAPAMTGRPGPPGGMFGRAPTSSPSGEPPVPPGEQGGRSGGQGSGQGGGGGSG